MPKIDDAVLQAMDRALIGMRRFLHTPRTVADGNAQIEMSTLLILDALQESSPASIAELAERLQVAHSTASRLVQRAVVAGMVTRHSGASSRQAAIVPTHAGTAVNGRARAFRHAQLVRRLDGWTAEEVGDFSRALTRFAMDSADRDPEPRAESQGQ